MQIQSQKPAKTAQSAVHFLLYAYRILTVVFVVTFQVWSMDLWDPISTEERLLYQPSLRVNLHSQSDLQGSTAESTRTTDLGDTKQQMIKEQISKHIVTLSVTEQNQDYDKPLQNDSSKLATTKQEAKENVLPNTTTEADSIIPKHSITTLSDPIDSDSVSQNPSLFHHSKNITISPESHQQQFSNTTVDQQALTPEKLRRRRAARFPSFEERLKIYTTSWYLPPCPPQTEQNNTTSPTTKTEFQFYPIETYRGVKIKPPLHSGKPFNLKPGLETGQMMTLDTHYMLNKQTLEKNLPTERYFKPTVSSWAMEELLVPWHHYVPLNRELSDAEEKMQWILDHEEEARRIAGRGRLFIYDLLFHEDARDENERLKKEVLRRMRAHFQESTSLV